tara:strand:- start:4743 stop:4907 length:165 start_codon:yes stop_codon:yes gene_type:complete
MRLTNYFTGKLRYEVIKGGKVIYSGFDRAEFYLKYEAMSDKKELFVRSIKETGV